MTRYLLDSDALIDFSKGAEPASSASLSWIDGDDEVAVCAITVAEFFAGLDQEQVASWEPFIAALWYWDISPEAARQAGRYRYTSVRAGRSMTTTDALVAAVAVERDALVVTGNVRHYAIGGVSLYPIRSSLQP